MSVVGTNTLEQTYRNALRWYPKKWRTRNEDAVVGTLLDVAEEAHRTTPARGELANLRANALATRLGPLGRIPAPVRDRVVALTFGLGAGIAIVALIAPLALNATLRGGDYHYPTFGTTSVFYVLWVLALAAALIGRRWIARGLAFAGILLAIADKILASHLPFSYDVASTSTTIVLALLTFIGNPFSSRRGRLWIGVAAASWAAFIGLTLVYWRATEGAGGGASDWFLGPFSEWMGFAFPFVIILALILTRTARSPWAPAILIAEVPIILLALLGWRDVPTLLNTAFYTLAIVATALGCYAILRGFGIRIRITRAENQ
jgi:hypothetical protein